MMSRGVINNFLGFVGVVVSGILLYAFIYGIGQQGKEKKEELEEGGKQLGRTFASIKVITGGAAFAILVLLFALNRANAHFFSGMAISSMAILAGIWVVCAVASAAFVKYNYDKAYTLLIPLSASARECRLLRLVFTIPLYTIVNHLLILAFLSEEFSDSLWGMEHVFDYNTMIKPSYLLFSAAVLAGSLAGGGIAVARKKAWDDEFFWIFVGASGGGGVLFGAAFVAFTMMMGAPSA